MKKLLSIFFSICMVFSLCAMTPVEASAYDSYVQDGAASSTITYRQQSEYSILIPETIDANAGQYVFQAGMLNISNNEQIYVTVANVNGDGRIEFQHENGINTLTKDIIIENSNPSYPVDLDALPNHCVGYFAGDDAASKIQFGLSDQSFDCDYPKAGNYSATVNFEVFLVENE